MVGDDSLWLWRVMTHSLAVVGDDSLWLLPLKPRCGVLLPVAWHKWCDGGGDDDEGGREGGGHSFGSIQHPRTPT